MKNFRSYLSMFVYSAVLFSVSAPAEDFPTAKAIKQSSMTRGLGESTLPVLHRVPATSQANVSTTLLRAVCPACSGTTQMKDGNLQTSSEDFSLSISSDGTAADFRDLSVAARSHSLAKPLAGKMSSAALEKAGSAFIASRLAGSIVLGPNEELFPLLTDYRIEGLQNVKTGAVTRSVAANRIAFGRKLNGIPIVGNGSMVVITFANDGSVESFHYDWPRYDAVGSQSMVAPSTLLARIQQAVSARSGVAPMFTAHLPDQGEGAATVDLDNNTKLQSMQCGYFDAGAASGLASVQPGCVYHAVHEQTNGMRSGYAGAIPAGVSFESDARWVESRIIK